MMILYAFTLFLWMVFSSDSAPISRTTRRIDLKPSAVGISSYILVHEYIPSPSSTSKSNQLTAYIQTSLHADEIPGLLVTQKLINILDEAAALGQIKQKIQVVSFANPLGLSQFVLGSHIGRFSLDSGVNFNRDWPDVSTSVIKRIAGKLKENDSDYNVNLIRKSILESVVEEGSSVKLDQVLKRELYKMAACADVFLDLHCDSASVLHMYTHDRLWPQVQDLAAEMGAQCVLLASDSGGRPADEVCSGLWAKVSDTYPNFKIPMACEAVTVELRGTLDVTDELAQSDANAIIRFLQGRGYISSMGEGQNCEPTPALVREATPLSGVDMIETPVYGVLVWRTQLGDVVKEGQVIAEVVDIEHPEANRVQLVSRTDGVLFARSLTHWVQAGQTVAKVAGSKPLHWRTGQLLTV